MIWSFFFQIKHHIHMVLCLVFRKFVFICCSGKETSSSSDLAPDISFIKVEESDTGGLDMYVDIPDDAKGALLSSQDEGDDDTGEIPYEWTQDESNEGSNLSGEQNMSLSGQEGAFQGGFSFLIVIYIFFILVWKFHHVLVEGHA